MHKMLISISMLGEMLNIVLSREIEFLCIDTGKGFNDVMSELNQCPDIPGINERLDALFPGELKIVK